MENDSQNQPATTPATSPPGNRSISKTIKSFGNAMFWFLWDFFWDKFNLASVGDEVREHSILMKKRVAVFITLIVIFILGVFFGWHSQRGKLDAANDTIKQLRVFNAGHPTKNSPAELMGLHDETNVIVVNATNTIVTTNVVTKSSTVTNMLTFYASNPVLDLFQMESIKSKLGSSTNFTVTVFYYQNDPDSIPLAKQIFQIFACSGFKLTDVKPSVVRASTGIMVSSVTIAPQPIYDAMMTLANFIGKSVVKDHEETNVMSNNDLWIFVSTTNK
jgi:hypothetical protein